MMVTEEDIAKSCSKEVVDCILKSLSMVTES